MLPQVLTNVHDATKNLIILTEVFIMARTIINLPLRNSVDESYNTAVNILQANGFKEVSYNGETVWKKRYRTFDCYAIHKN